MVTSVAATSSIPVEAYCQVHGEGRSLVSFHCKQTLELRMGAIAHAERQEPLYHRAQRWDPHFPLRIDRPSDVGPRRAFVDVVIGPRRHRTRGPLRLAVGALDKRVTQASSVGATRDAIEEFFPRDLSPDSREQLAAADQRLAELAHDEVLVLENVIGETPNIRARLSMIRPVARISVPDGPPIAVAMTPALLCIDPDNRTCTVTFRGEIDVASVVVPHEGVVVVDGDEANRLVVPLVPLAAWSVLADTEPDSETFTGGSPLPTSGDDQEHTSSVDLEKLVSASRAVPFDGMTSSARAARSPFVDLASLRAELERSGRAVPEEPKQPEIVRKSVAAPSLGDTPIAAPIEHVSIKPVDASAPRASLPLSALLRARVGPARSTVLDDSSEAIEPDRAIREEGPSTSTSSTPKSPLELIWFDTKWHRKLRRNSDWLPLMPEPSAPPKAERGKPPPPPPHPDDVAEAQRADVVAVLSKAKELPIEFDSASLSDDGAGPPLQLVSGALELRFDEAELLKATVTSAEPFAANGPLLRERIEAAKAIMGTGLESAPEVTHAHVRGIREAWRRSSGSLSADFLEQHTERLLLTQRSYQLRKLLDDEMLRAWFSSDAFPDGIPAYIPASTDKRLPMFPSFRVRMLVMLVPRQEAYERPQLALRVVALARLLDETR